MDYFTTNRLRCVDIPTNHKVYLGTLRSSLAAPAAAFGKGSSCRPPRYGLSTSGTTTPSRVWWFSSTQHSVRCVAVSVALSMCTWLLPREAALPAGEDWRRRMSRRLACKGDAGAAGRRGWGGERQEKWGLFPFLVPSPIPLPPQPPLLGRCISWLTPASYPSPSSITHQQLPVLLYLVLGATGG